MQFPLAKKNHTESSSSPGRDGSGLGYNYEETPQTPRAVTTTAETLRSPSGAAGCAHRNLPRSRVPLNSGGAIPATSLLEAIFLSSVGSGVRVGPLRCRDLEPKGSRKRASMPLCDRLVFCRPRIRLVRWKEEVEGGVSWSASSFKGGRGGWSSISTPGGRKLRSLRP